MFPPEICMFWTTPDPFSFVILWPKRSYLVLLPVTFRILRDLKSTTKHPQPPWAYCEIPGYTVHRIRKISLVLGEWRPGLDFRVRETVDPVIPRLVEESAISERCPSSSRRASLSYSFYKNRPQFTNNRYCKVFPCWKFICSPV